jgi:hypothetical protein
VAIQLTPVSKAHWSIVQMTNYASVPDFSTWTIMRLKSLLFTEKLHADWTVWDLFIWMPRTEMGEQIVLLVEVKRTDKAFESPPLFMESLHVCQQQSSL